MIHNFEFKKLGLEGAYMIIPFFNKDDRGIFIKDYQEEIFRKNGINHQIREIFYSESSKGVIRGIHFQLGNQQQKLVRCIKGCIYDVIVDLRPDSVTFGKWEGFYLSEENVKSLFIPEYFGHAFLALEESIVSYKCSKVFDSQGDSGIIYNDADIQINWPYDEIGGKDNIIISQKDKLLMNFSEYKKLSLGI